MSGFVLGYYFYSSRDNKLAAGFEKLANERSLAVDNISCQRGATVPAIGGLEGTSIYRVESNPMAAILIAQSVVDASEIAGVVRKWEEAAEGLLEDLLGRSYVVVGFADLEAALGQLPRVRPDHRLEFKVRGHACLRDGWGWVDGQANYAFASLDNHYLLRELPLAEMASRRAELLRRYYHDQLSTITAEKDETEQELSKILYSTLVPTNRQEEASHLEEDMMNLSKGYGVLTSNHRLVREGMNRLQQQISALEKAVNIKGFDAESDFTEIMLEPFSSFVRDLQELSVSLTETRDNQRAGIEVVRGKIDVLMSKESLNLQTKVMEVMEMSNKMQAQSLTFQVAASLIEFVILAYYGLSLWKYLDETGYHGVPGWMAAVLILSFAGDVTFLTHLVAERIQGEEGLVCKTIVAVVVLVAVLSLMIFGHLMFAGHGAPAH
ncbi:MAG: hypothetical protein ACM3UZ_02425 [Acidobacteriota bacterium]